MIRYSNTDLIKILQNPDKSKLSHELPIKPKGGEVFVFDWQNNESRIKDYVTDKYLWVADTTETSNHSGISLVKKYYNIRDHESSVAHPRKMPHSKEFRKTVAYIKSNPFLQVIEYIGNEKVYKPQPHGNAKDKDRQ